MNMKISCFYIQRYNRTARSRQPWRGVQNIPPKSRYLSTKLDTHTEGRLHKYLTPRNRVLLQKLIAPKLLRKFPAYHGTRIFITAFTTAHLCPILSQMNPNQLYFNYFNYYFNIILGNRSDFFPFRFPRQNSIFNSLLLHACHMPRPSHSPLFRHPNNIWNTHHAGRRYAVFYSPVPSSISSQNIFLSTLFTNTLSLCWHNPLTTAINLNNIHRPCSYHAVNTLLLGYKNHSVNDV